MMSVTSRSVAAIFLATAALSRPAYGAADHSARWLYVLHCSGCHGQSGHGDPAAGIPEFNNSIGNILRHEDGKRYVVNVAGVRNAGLSDDEVARVLNYILSRWGSGDDADSAFTGPEVGKLKSNEIDIVSTRKKIENYLSGKGLHYSTYPW